MINARHALSRLRDALCLPKGSARLTRFRSASAQTGSVAIIFCVSLMVIFAIFGLTFDLGRLYNRRIEMQTLADAVALAAARELNGTPQGLTNALTKAGLAAGKIKYDYKQNPVSWSESAIKFGSSPQLDSTWMDAGSAAGSEQNLSYVKVETKDLALPHGTLETWFMRLLPTGSTTASANGRAIAGASMINVTPFAICALSPLAADKRANPGSAGPPVAPAKDELVEYGFRRGVGYDLMKLNYSTDTTLTAKNYLVNPVAPPGTTGLAADMTDAAVGPFLCAGTMAMSRVRGGTITVSSPFPMASLFDRFNSRFDDFSSGNCDPWAAPPDTNIWKYTGATSAVNAPWMSPANPQQVAQATSTAPLRTLADPVPPTPPNPTLAGQYGVLWTFARAVPWSSYSAGQSEPSGGYATFAKTDWPSLYDPARPASIGTHHNGSAMPYSNLSTVALPSLAHRPGIKNRRVLNVPLLSCPVSGSSATVLGLGRFFMTVPATSSNLYAEFAGLASESSLVSTLELHP